MRRRRAFAVSLSTAVKCLMCFLCVNSVQGSVLNVHVSYNSCSKCEMPTSSMSMTNGFCCGTMTYARYSYNTLFNHIPYTGIVGHLFLPTPVDACSYIDPPPRGAHIDSTYAWIALVYNYPSCLSDMVMNVRNAGYRLIIASSRNYSLQTVLNAVSNTPLPIVILRKKDADHLKKIVTSLPDDPILVHVFLPDHVAAIVKESIPFPSILALILTAILGCGCYMTLYHQNYHYMYNNMHPILREMRHFEPLLVDEQQGSREPTESIQRQIHEQQGRRELIESIQRQILDLQLDLRMQIPLGRQLAQRLPMRKYTANGETSETCVICVDEFTEEDQVRVLPCNHIFHPQCIDEWLGEHSSLCPLCKKRVPRVISPSEGQNVSEETFDSLDLELD